MSFANLSGNNFGKGFFVFCQQKANITDNFASYGSRSIFPGLKSSLGSFTGIFNMPNETLTGQFNELLGVTKTRAGLLDPATMKLTCISHPRVKLELNADDAM